VFPDPEFQNRRDWHPDITKMVPLNPAGSIVQGHNVDGMFPNEMGRIPFTWPVPTTKPDGSQPDHIQYSWGCVEGLVVTTTLLRRAGYDAHLWSDKAVWRALQSLYQVIGVKAEGDDVFEIDLLGYLYGDEAKFALQSQLPLTDSRAHAIGKNMAGTSWSHRGRTFGPVTPPDDCEALRAELEALEASYASLAAELARVQGANGILAAYNARLNDRIAKVKAAVNE
jgi:hypothetical protein